MRFSLVVLVLTSLPVWAAPIPKSVEVEKRLQYERLKAEYDQKVKDYGNSIQGMELALDIEAAKVLAKEALVIEKPTDDKDKIKTREALVQNRVAICKESPRIGELFTLYLYELSHSK